MKWCLLFLTILCLLPAIGNAQSYPDYKGKPWVENESRPYSISRGLEGRHISLWPSHGRYFDNNKATWKWQRPYFFCTTEDLYTQSVVNQLLIPMLENAGAVVFTPRERDRQLSEIIVDNDDPGSGYTEANGKKATWSTAGTLGFKYHSGSYGEDENPFQAGTARIIPITKKAKNAGFAVWRPRFAKAGRYAVYVSYQSTHESVDDAEYTVHHKGSSTVFHVNQQMGGGTWVYLGTFDFGSGSSDLNCVVLSNRSGAKGVVSADAVRFGGGMGNIERGGNVSGLPRYLEGARYWVQWAGAPFSVYSYSEGTIDYNDDINCRSQMLNWLAGGSVYEPQNDGLRVPLEMSLALHTDARYDAYNTVGTLGICTTGMGTQDIMGIEGGRKYSKTLAETVQSGVVNTIRRIAPTWNSRGIWDKNYSETRRPDVPSTIIEALAHQNFNDMKLAHDPNFKFLLARSIYHSVLGYLSKVHDFQSTTTPLTPVGFSATVKDKYAILSWTPANDTIYHSTASKYIVYTAMGNAGYDNGTIVSRTQMRMELEPGVKYRFRVSAVNDGGESFRSEELVAMRRLRPTNNLLIVNGFTRIAAPQVVETDTTAGFDIDADAGIGYEVTTSLSGRQLCYDKSTGGSEGEGTLGYSGNELEGKAICGNTFDYPNTHADDMKNLTGCNISSASAKAVENGSVKLDRFDGVDLILGGQRRDGYSLVDYKSIPFVLSTKLSTYHNRGGHIMVSGAYTGADMQSDADRQFMQAVLGVAGSGTTAMAGNIAGLGRDFSIISTLNPDHYAAPRVSVLSKTAQSFCAMQYADGRAAAVASNKQQGHTFVMGFPFECISGATTRAQLMTGIWRFLLDKP